MGHACVYHRLSGLPGLGPHIGVQFFTCKAAFFTGLKFFGAASPVKTACPDLIVNLRVRNDKTVLVVYQGGTVHGLAVKEELLLGLSEEGLYFASLDDVLFIFHIYNFIWIMKTKYTQRVKFILLKEF